MEEFLRDQREKLESYGLVYYSIGLELSRDKEGRLKKGAKGLPKYKDKKVKSKVDELKNGMIILLGKRYGGLIGVDVDNKNDTVRFFKEMSEEQGYDLDTLTVRTVND